MQEAMKKIAEELNEAVNAATKVKDDAAGADEAVDEIDKANK
jgi:hypothetical protein